MIKLHRFELMEASNATLNVMSEAMPTHRNAIMRDRAKIESSISSNNSGAHAAMEQAAVNCTAVDRTVCSSSAL